MYNEQGEIDGHGGFKVIYSGAYFGTEFECRY
jgi:hypothetical protein